jgi:hypothetical protein
VNAEAAGELSALAALPELGTYNKVLYVGANTTRFQLYGLFAYESLYVLEVYDPYVKALRDSKKYPVARVLRGNILDLEASQELRLLAPFGLIVWWHGPEHVEIGALEGLLGPQGSIHKWYTGAILLGCPWGRYEQGAVDGNVWQKHVSHLNPEFFTERGYQVSTVGQRDTKDGAITVWRRAARPMQRPGKAVAVGLPGS